MKKHAWTGLFLSIIVIRLVFPALIQAKDKARRGEAEEMLKNIASDVRDHYYDPTFHGIDWDAAVAKAQQKIAQSNSFTADMFTIADLLNQFGDSGLRFMPPPHPYSTDFGWHGTMIGDRCYVVGVRPGSDADKKGLRTGDEIIAMNGRVLTRENIEDITYVYSTLLGQTTEDLLVQGPAGAQRKLTLEAKTHSIVIRPYTFGTVRPSNFYWDEWLQDRRWESRFVDLNSDITIFKLGDLNLSLWIDSFRSRTHNRHGLILDLRYNGSGDIGALKSLAGVVFNKEVTIGDQVERKKSKPMISEIEPDPFTGKLVVLVNGDTSGAAEMFARLVQIEKRGIVIGDRTAGIAGGIVDIYRHDNTGLPYGVIVPIAGFNMSDHKNLDHIGVTPDELLVPTAADLAAGRDPVLAHAAAEMGVEITPEKAAKLFPDMSWAESDLEIYK